MDNSQQHGRGLGFDSLHFDVIIGVTFRAGKTWLIRSVQKKGTNLSARIEIAEVSLYSHCYMPDAAVGRCSNSMSENGTVTLPTEATRAMSEHLADSSLLYQLAASFTYSVGKPVDLD
jgi:hypothetical protein